MIVAFAPSPALDRTLVVDELRIGEIHRPSRVVAVAGGKGLNVARAAHALGAPVTAVTALGGATGDGVRRLLEAGDVPHLAVTVSAETRVCTTVAAGGAGLTEFYEPAPALRADEWRRLEEALLDVLAAGAAWLTISGSIPAGSGAEAVEGFVSAAHARDVRVAVDTHGAPLEAAVAAGADVVKVNVDEARALLRRPGLGPREAALALAATGVARRLTVVTGGTLGAWAIDRGEVRHVRPGRFGAFPVGSGDCFLAGLVTSLARDPDDVDAALRLATATAAANARRPGAAVLDPFPPP